MNNNHIHNNNTYTNNRQQQLKQEWQRRLQPSSLTLCMHQASQGQRIAGRSTQCTLPPKTRTRLAIVIHTAYMEYDSSRRLSAMAQLP